MRMIVRLMVGAAVAITSPAMGQGIPKPIPKPTPKATPKPAAPRAIPRPAPRPPTRPAARAPARAAGNSEVATADPNPWAFNAQDNQVYFAPQAEAQTTGGYGIMFSLILRCDAPGRIVAQFGTLPGIGQAYISAYGERPITAYINGIVNPANTIQAYRSGQLAVSIREDQPVTPSLLAAMAGADRFSVTGGRRAMPFAGAGSQAAIESVARACRVALPKVNALGVVIAPAVPIVPVLAADIPPEFAAGTLKLKKTGGCTRFYDQGGRVGVSQAFNKDDFNGVVRVVIDHGCNTDLAWLMLGLSAKAFGQPAAARVYLTQAITVGRKFILTNIKNTCAHLTTIQNPCLGVDVPQVATAALNSLPRE